MPFNPPLDEGTYGILWRISNQNESGLTLRDPLELGDGWEEVFINPDNDTVLNAFYIDLIPYYDRPRTPTTDPETGITTPGTPVRDTATITTIDTLTITCTQRGGDLFTEPDRLYTTPGTISARVGILDGSYYKWAKVFDQSRVKYLPGESVESPLIDGADVEVESLSLLPEEPSDLDADPPVYPMDIFTSIRPDDRPFVILTYTATFSGTIDGFPYAETVTWYHTVWQKAYDWGGYVANALGESTYFFNDYTSDKRPFPEGYPATNPNAPE